MRIIRVGTNLSESASREAAAVLRRGGIVVYPTETAYAIGCDATSAAAKRKIHAIKGREKGKPLPMIVADAAMARRFGRLDPMSAALAGAFWPGPLTLVLGDSAMRVSPHPVARGLARRLGRPVVSTSANRSGGKNPYRLADVLRDLGTAPDLCIDGGTLRKRKPSTIVRCGRDVCEILRQGPISSARIINALERCDRL